MFSVTPEALFINLGFFWLLSVNSQGEQWGTTRWQLLLPWDLVVEGHYPQSYPVPGLD